MAEASYLAEELEEIVTCTICCDILKEPKMLPCLHTFCLKCIEEWHQQCQRDRKPFVCPSCRSVIKLPDNVWNLPTSFHHNHLLQVYKNMKAMKGDDEQELLECFSCSSHRTLIGSCFQCGGMICNDCYKAHNTIKTLKQYHKAVLLSELKKENPVVDLEIFCNENLHEKCPLEHYCQTCKKNICAKCVIDKHYIHKFINIEQEGEDCKSRLLKQKERLQTVLIMHERESKLSHENRIRIENEVDKAKENLRAATSVPELEDAQITKLNNYLEDLTEDNDEEIREIDTAIEQVKKLLDQCTATEILDAKQFMLKGHDKLEEVCQTAVKGTLILPTRPVKRYSSIRFIPSLTGESGSIEVSMTNPSRCSIESLSSARCGFSNSFSIVTRDTKGDECYTSMALIDVQIQDIAGNQVDKEITESKLGIYSVKYKTQIPFPYLFAVSIGGTPVNNSPQQAETLDAKAEMKTIHIFQVTKDPMSLAVNEEGLIAVVNDEDEDDDHRIVLYNIDGDFLTEFGHEGEQQAELKDPRGVCFIEDHIVVIDNDEDNGYLKLFDINGNFKTSIFIQRPIVFSSLCEANEFIACLTRDITNKQTLIKLICKQTYEVLQDIPLDVSKDWIPWSIAYANSMYFISFFNVNSIFVFDDKGELLHTIGEQGNKKGQLNYPFGIAVFGTDMLLVCDGDNNRVQLFNQDGQFIWSYGIYGKCLSGQMKVPVDVGVTPQGRVVVLELIGRRLQVLR